MMMNTYHKKNGETRKPTYKKMVVKDFQGMAYPRHPVTTPEVRDLDF